MNSNYICISYIHGNSICICTTILTINIKLYFMFFFLKLSELFLTSFISITTQIIRKSITISIILSILLFLLVHFIFVIIRILYIVFYNDMIRYKKKQCENKNYYFHFQSLITFIISDAKIEKH